MSLVVLLLHTFHTFDCLIPHRMNFVPISGAREHSQFSDAVVDDTSVLFTLSEEISHSELISRLEEIAQTWEKLLFLSGGTLNLNKCSWYVLQWEWKNGQPIIRKIKSDDPPVQLSQGGDSTPTVIQRHPPSHSTRMFGVYLNPMGDFTDHLQTLKKKSD